MDLNDLITKYNNTPRWKRVWWRASGVVSRVPSNIRYYVARKPRYIVARLRKGVSWEDAWSFDHYIAGVLAEGLELLANKNHGVNMKYIQDDEDIEVSAERQKQDYLEQAARWKRYSKSEYFGGDFTQEELNEMFDWMKEHFTGLWD